MKILNENLILCRSRSTCRSTFLVRFTNPNQKLPNIKSVFKFLNQWFRVQEIYRFITFLVIEILFIKQCTTKLMSGNKWWSTKVAENFLSDLVIFFVFLSDIPLDFQESSQEVPVKYLMYLSVAQILNNFQVFLQKNILLH